MDRLSERIASELSKVVDSKVLHYVRGIVGETCPLGVLFYGSGLRDRDVGGLLDFYVLVERLQDWPMPNLHRALNYLLPPNVYYVESMVGETVFRAKVAVMTIAQFSARAQPRSYDTTIWARFSQPTRLVWVRDRRAADQILAGVRQCVLSAAGWAACFNQGPLTADVWWEALYARTYAAELRAEKTSRSKALISAYRAWYDAILPDAWRALGIYNVSEERALLSPSLSSSARARALRRWEKIASNGRCLNVMRLFKAAITFNGGARYLFWKINRHRGSTLGLSRFEAAHPLLCLPWLVLRVRRAFKTTPD